MTAIKIAILDTIEIIDLVLTPDVINLARFDVIKKSITANQINLLTYGNNRLKLT